MGQHPLIHDPCDPSNNGDPCDGCDPWPMHRPIAYPAPSTGVGLNSLDSKGSYSVTSNNTKLVHWPLMGGLLYLVQRGGARA